MFLLIDFGTEKKMFGHFKIILPKKLVINL